LIRSLAPLFQQNFPRYWRHRPCGKLQYGGISSTANPARWLLLPVLTTISPGCRIRPRVTEDIGAGRQFQN